MVGLRPPKRDFLHCNIATGPNVMIQNVQDYFRTAGFIWADKIALLVGLLFSLLLLLLWSLAFFLVGSLGAKHMWGSFGVQGVGLTILIVGTIWLMMRVTDLFIAGSPRPHSMSAIGAKRTLD
jgi:hypothetical protein